MYPINLRLAGVPCLVVGGGGTAVRKIQGLIAEDADVTVVAPEVVEAVSVMASRQLIALHCRGYAQGEAARYGLVFAAADDRAVNRQVCEDAVFANVWVNAADDAERCTFHLPARIQRKSLQLAVSSTGDAPFVSRRLRKLFEKKLGEEWSVWADAAARFRMRVKAMKVSKEEEDVLFDRFFDATVDEDNLTARVATSAEAEEWLGGMGSGVSGVRDGNGHLLFRTSDHFRTQYGLVSLVGAGPGDPGLLTLRGRECLRRAGVVVCDRLAVPALPCDIPARTEIVFVGKEAGRHPMPQEEINALLVRLARQGMRVVRLKGGDPYVFGRGGEEAATLAREGIPFEVVPGVTAATAVTAYAGIPVTYRNRAVRVTLVTAHEAVKRNGPQVRWDLLAADPHSLIVGYMGGTTLPKVTAALLQAGLDPDTPAAFIERGTTPVQRKVISTVQHLVRDVERGGLKPPALFAIGPTVGSSELLDWFGKRPLMGERLVAFHPDADLMECLRIAGAEILPLPVPVTPAARMVMDCLPLTGAIFSSVDEVDLLEDERGRKSWPQSPVAWCLTEFAARRAREKGWPDVRCVIGQDALLEAMMKSVSG